MTNPVSAREMEELEGALLLPEATLVVEDDENDQDKATSSEATAAATPASVLEVEASVPASYFATGYGTSSTNASSPIHASSIADAPHAPVIPRGEFAKTNLHDSARDARDLQTAQRRGYLSAEEERVANQRNAREIRAIQYHQSQAIRQANQHARLKEWEATHGIDQTTAAMAERQPYDPSKDTTPPQSQNTTNGTASSEPPSTFGKDYEVAEYSVGEGYDTQDYQVSEYKSIYE